MLLLRCQDLVAELNWEDVVPSKFLRNDQRKWSSCASANARHFSKGLTPA
jgi:hypothetical protein